MNCSITHIAKNKVNLTYPLFFLLLFFFASVAILIYPQYITLIASFAILIVTITVNYMVCKTVVHPVFLTLFAFILYYGIGLLVIGVENGNFVNFFYLIIALFSFTAGAFLYIRVFKIKPKDFMRCFNSKRFDDTTIPSNIALFSLWLLGFFFWLYLVMRVGIPAFTGDVSIRYKISGLTTSMFELFWPISCVTFYIKSKKFKSQKLLFFTFFLVSVSVILFSLLLHRYATLQLLLTLIIANFYLKDNSFEGYLLKAYIRNALIFIVVMISVQYARSCLWGAEYGIKLLLDITISRLVLIGAKTLNFIFDAFPGSYDFFYGLTYIRVIRNFYYPEDKMPSLGYFLYSAVTGHSTPGYDPVSILGEFYINFGFPGMVTGMLLFGFISQWFFLKTLSRKTIYRLSFYSICTMLVMRSFAYSFPGEIYNLIIVFFAFALVFVFSPGKNKQIVKE